MFQVKKAFTCLLTAGALAMFLSPKTALGDEFLNDDDSALALSAGADDDVDYACQSSDDPVCQQRDECSKNFMTNEDCTNFCAVFPNDQACQSLYNQDASTAPAMDLARGGGGHGGGGGRGGGGHGGGFGRGGFGHGGFGRGGFGRGGFGRGGFGRGGFGRGGFGRGGFGRGGFGRGGFGRGGVFGRGGWRRGGHWGRRGWGWGGWRRGRWVRRGFCYWHPFAPACWL